MSYDSWKLATPPEYDYQPECSACDDAGCPECTETQPITLDDLEDMEAQMRYAPDNLELCPDHPEALVRRIFDADFYCWPDGRTSAPLRGHTVKFECSACGHELREVAVSATECKS